MLDTNPAPNLTVDVTVLDGSRRRLRVAGELDLATAAVLESHLTAELDGRHDVELELAEVSFVDSTGLRVLVEGSRRAADRGVQLVLLVPLPPQMQRVLEVTGLSERLTVAPSPAGRES